MLVSFVIPCYNSQNTIGDIVDRIDCTFYREFPRFTHEIILIDDHSADHTLDTIRRICADLTHVKGASFSRNFGQHAALMAGLRMSKGDIVVCLDDDGQTLPEESPKLINRLLEGHDIVFGRYPQKKHNIFRNLTSSINSWMIQKFLGKPKDLYLSSYIAIRSFIVKEVIRYQNPYPYMAGLLLRSTSNVVNVDMMHHSRDDGKSGYTFGRLIKLWLNGVTSFSVKPLRIATFLGAVMAALGFVAVLYILINKLVHPDVALGWSSIMGTLAFIGGIILIVLGMIGEYIGRVFISLNKSPQYVIGNRINVEEDDDRK